MSGRIGILLVLLLAVLTAGTLQAKLLASGYATFALPGTWAYGLQNWVDTLLSANPWLGIDGIGVHDVFLIVLLTLTGIAAWQGSKRTTSKARSSGRSAGPVGIAGGVPSLRQSYGGESRVRVRGRQKVIPQEEKGVLARALSADAPSAVEGLVFSGH